MNFRLKLILAVFLLVVIPILVTGLVTMETANNALQLQALKGGVAINPELIQISRLRENIIYMLIIGTIVSFAGAGIFTSEIAGSVNRIKAGLDALARDTNIKIYPMRGIMGEIATSINSMADTLRETRSHRDALLESSPNGVITVDKQSRVVLFNPAASILTGIEPKTALGSHYNNIGLAGHLVSLIESTLNQDEAISAQEEIYPRPDGTSVAMAVTGSRLHDYSGETVGAVVLLIDLREKRLLEAQVLRANRLAGLGELAAGIAHEIRNPLTSVKGYAQILEEELPDHDERREYTAVIVKEVNRLDRIVQELLVFARPAASRFTRVNINEVMEETLVLVENSSFKRRIELVKDYGSKIWAEADQAQLKQIFLNLLLNSAQAIKDKGKIKIITTAHLNTVEISVIDSGAGIPPQNLEKLFDPFFTTKEEGSGLGLAIVHQLVELHHGKIHVQSVLQEFTEIRITLPVSQGGADGV